MIKTNKKRMSTQTLVLLALLTAMVSVLAYYGAFIKINPTTSINLTLIPVVLGACLCGPWAGAWLGGVSGAVFLATPDSLYWLSLSVIGTVITVMVKGILAGLCAGLAYKLIRKYNRYLAVMVAAMVCPIVNTGLFIVGAFVFFADTITAGAAANGSSVLMFIITVWIGFNFVLEFLVNVAVSPAIVRILDIAKKLMKKVK